jgi:hypothetical protein
VVLHRKSGLALLSDHDVLSRFCELRIHVAVDRGVVPPAQTRSNASTRPYPQKPARSAPLAARADWEIESVRGKMNYGDDFGFSWRLSQGSLVGNVRFDVRPHLTARRCLVWSLSHKTDSNTARDKLLGV